MNRNIPTEYEEVFAKYLFMQRIAQDIRREGTPEERRAFTLKQAEVRERLRNLAAVEIKE